MSTSPMFDAVAGTLGSNAFMAAGTLAENDNVLHAARDMAGENMSFDFSRNAEIRAPIIGGNGPSDKGFSR